MTKNEIAQNWVKNNFPEMSAEEKERLAYAFVSGMTEIENQGITIKGRIEGDWANDKTEPNEIYAVSESLPLDGELQYADQVTIHIIKN